MMNELLYRSLGKREGQSKIPIDVTGEMKGSVNVPIDITGEKIGSANAGADTGSQ